jgi:TDG/mug DNA glycosylase family protein
MDLMNPTREELEQARGRLLPDVVADNLAVLFCGINPGLWSAATGEHFGRPGNRFWPALHASGFTPRRFAPAEQSELLALGLGITNVVARPTARAEELSAAELRQGGAVLARKVRRRRPQWLAVVGVTAYRTGFDAPRATVGEQERTVGAARVWVLPSTSGLNAHWSAAGLADAFAELRRATELAEDDGATAR